MSSKKKNDVKEQEIFTPEEEQALEQVKEAVMGEQEEIKVEPEKVEKSKNEPKSKVNSKNEPKYKIGSIVFVSKDAEADLNGFKLFPQYKKYTYTVEAYDGSGDVYTLRRLNLSLRLKECDIMAPNEKSGSELYKKQY